MPNIELKDALDANMRTTPATPTPGQSYTVGPSAAIVAGAAAGTSAAASLATHVANTSNPHGVTAAQAGADPAGTAASAVAAHLAAYDHDAFATRLTAGSQTLYLNPNIVGGDGSGDSEENAIATWEDAVAATVAFRGIYEVTWMLAGTEGEDSNHIAGPVPPSVTAIKGYDSARAVDLTFTAGGGTTATSIVTSGLTAEEWRGYTLTQSVTGKKRTIKGHTTTAIEPCATFTSASSGQQFTISHATAIIEQPPDTDYDEWEFITGGRIRLENVALSGYFPIRAQYLEMVGVDFVYGQPIIASEYAVFGDQSEPALGYGWGLAGLVGEDGYYQTIGTAYGQVVSSDVWVDPGATLTLYRGYAGGIDGSAGGRVTLFQSYLGDVTATGIALDLYSHTRVHLGSGTVRGANNSGPLVRARGRAGALTIHSGFGGVNAGTGTTLEVLYGAQVDVEGALALGDGSADDVTIDGVTYARTEWSTLNGGQVNQSNGSAVRRVS